MARYPAIRISRTKRNYASAPAVESGLVIHDAASSSDPRNSAVTAYVAIGTNLGDRIANIKAATNQLEDVEGEDEDLVENRETVKVKRVSRLYESVPMYMLDQGEFVNGVIEVRCPAYVCRGVTGTDWRKR